MLEKSQFGIEKHPQVKFQFSKIWRKLEKKGFDFPIKNNWTLSLLVTFPRANNAVPCHGNYPL